MATMAPAPISTTTITPPSSSHGIRKSWGFHDTHKDDADYDVGTRHASHERVNKAHHGPQNGHAVGPGQHFVVAEPTSRKLNSNDNLPGAKSGRPADAGIASTSGHETKTSPTTDEYPRTLHSHHQNQNQNPNQNGDDHRRSVAYSLDQELEDDNSKWIHRDKLARIESKELQAAGIFIPRTRAPSKQRRERDRSRSAMRRATDASEPGHRRSQSHTRSRKNSFSGPDPRGSEVAVENWDLRTPEEIAAEEERNAYFAANNHKGSRIPLPKAIPAAIPMNYLDRASLRKASDSPEEDNTQTHPKTRSRSASMRGSDATLAGTGAGTVTGTGTGTVPPPAKRHAPDASPKKNATGPRKTSAASRTSTSTGRPKTRSGSNKDSTGGVMTRPSTRSGELSPNNKAPEGDPPWMINTYKPDPRLPPDQQLLPTVARRLQQEKWEKEGKFGDVYDKDFRPLNDNVFLKPPEPEKNQPADEESQQSAADEWPLKMEPAKSPTLRQGGSYSTMPKISDKPPQSPLPSPRTPVTPHAPFPEPAPSRSEPKAQERLPQESDKKEGCGCCVVM